MINESYRKLRILLIQRDGKVRYLPCKGGPPQPYIRILRRTNSIISRNIWSSYKEDFIEFKFHHSMTNYSYSSNVYWQIGGEEKHRTSESIFRFPTAYPPGEAGEPL